MIVWIASFPRSGNTFFRIALHELYGVSTYTASGFLSEDDLEIDLGRSDITGHSKLPINSSGKDSLKGTIRTKCLLDELDSESKVYFIKTHAHPSELWDSQYRAILLVRDGRDASISFAKYLINTAGTWPRFMKMILALNKSGSLVSVSSLKLITVRAFNSSIIYLAKNFGFEKKLYKYLRNKYLMKYGYWTSMNSEWIDRPNAQTSVIRFEDLIQNPGECVKQALNELDLRIPKSDGNLPTFIELNKLHPSFFRNGRSGEWKKELTEEINEKFWGKHGRMMSKFGYHKTRY